MAETAALAKAKPVPMTQVRIADAFWDDYIRLVKDVVVPYQWEAINDRVPGAEPSGAVRNFKIAAGLAQGDFYGFVFQDSDVAKWLEAVGYLLAKERDPDLEAVADGMIEIIAQAQQPDGYLNTYFTIKEPGRRWTNLMDCHELYCAGHMIEAAVSYYRATGKRRLLDVVIRFADYIDSVFGPEEGRLNGYDGHQEVELALVKLYEATEDRKYLRLAQYFLDARGTSPSFFEHEADGRGRRSHWGFTHRELELAYFQAHRPVREQTEAVGHAVRFAYMVAGMADVAAETGDEALLAACRRLWDNMTERQMYVTGGIGSMAQGEAFSFDYDLPNDTVYAETCASIGLVFVAHRMLQIEPDAKYADEMERALYNTVVGGMSLDGKHFFYVNPLEVDPKACGGRNKKFDHVKPVRQEWFGCACCPPNVARLLASLGEYVYAVKDDTVYVHLYVGGEADFRLPRTELKLIQRSDYPWSGSISFEVHPNQADASFTLALRLPGWSPSAVLRVNGEPIDYRTANGYARIERTWRAGDIVSLELEMPAMRLRCHPAVRANVGKTAIQRGPLVYCLEQADNGEALHELVLPATGELKVREAAHLLGGVRVIEAEGIRARAEPWNGGLYRPDAILRETGQNLTFIPYYAWANRGEGEMAVWVREC
ncbi:glycoside hydrolase family 127 protein [Cohnella sp. REN36]|uniref:glycoside hydrolase family 127 protein n=1 Tax=Cohnella sp. REN36 TaxID=2887347 RepID=UPI001D1377E4|nr:beta-L-arabinofuranosidase domain-containing protein [Cohnella sp. REN36]MCC3375331.1 glycoside hydrolase family 127 protein [Cohnella sp. REN36]